MTREEKLEIYEDAKEAYYRGDPLMSDTEFDELEKELGLENNAYIGTHHSSEYTIKHPFLMGSLSKIQIKEDFKFINPEYSTPEYKNDLSHIDFKKYMSEAETYLKKSLKYGLPGWQYQTTPKYDGCSVEFVIDNKGNLVSASTRGDGEYGKSIYDWVNNEWERNFRIKSFQLFKYGKLPANIKYLVVRGECLVKTHVFEKKYKGTFVNPRSFVAGLLGQDWKNTPEQISYRKDLDFICYDYRFVFNDGTVEEIDYLKSNTVGGIGLPGLFPEFHQIHNFISARILSTIYDKYEYFREHETGFALDGFVIKPSPQFRLQELDRERQRDCIAIKFLPEIVTTTIENIEWNVGKTGEYFPTAICKEVILGDKKVTRASLHNYDNILEKKIEIGSQIKLSLAGDIIPFVYDVIKVDRPKGKPLNLNLPSDAKPNMNVTNNGTKIVWHLMKDTSERDNKYISLISSVNTLKINGIGEKVADRLFNEVSEENNILNFMFNDKLELIRNTFGESKSTNNIIDALIGRRKEITLYDIILSLCFSNCGQKTSKIVTNIILGKAVESKGVNKEVYAWANNPDSYERRLIQKYIDMFNINISPVEEEETSEKKIKIIMTGDPSQCTDFSTKKKWLEAHPQYEETTSWKEVEILFTNDLSSSTSKMTKAKKLGIEIKKYEK